MARNSPLIGTALVVLALDQASKAVVLRGLRLDEVGSIEVLPPLVNLRMAWNRGVNFGLLPAESELGRWALIALALAISAWVWAWVRREGHGRAMQLAAGLLIGGALGNVIDRLIHGAVADFLNMSCCGIDNPFSFNLADVAIFLGALGLVWFSGPGGPAGAKDRP